MLPNLHPRERFGPASGNGHRPVPDLAAAAKLAPIRLHDLRHGAASLMLAAGVPAKVVQETLGHSTITLTLDTYTSVYSEVAAEAAEAAAALVPRARTSAHTPHTHPTPGTSRGPGNPWSDSGVGGARTHDLTDYESQGDDDVE
jgi:Phage integrase family